MTNFFDEKYPLLQEGDGGGAEDAGDATLMKPSRRTLILAALGVAVLVVLMVLGGRWFSSRRFHKQWSLVRAGMSKREVESLLGTPDSIYPVTQFRLTSPVDSLLEKVILDAFHEKWAYGRRRSIVLQKGFPYVGLAHDGLLAPEDGDYVVYFSGEGTVLKKRHPY